MTLQNVCDLFVIERITLNFHRLYCTPGKFITLKYVPYDVPIDHELHANEEQNCSEQKKLVSY